MARWVVNGHYVFYCAGQIEVSCPGHVVSCSSPSLKRGQSVCSMLAIAILAKEMAEGAWPNLAHNRFYLATDQMFPFGFFVSHFRISSILPCNILYLVITVLWLLYFLEAYHTHVYAITHQWKKLSYVNPHNCGRNKLSFMRHHKILAIFCL